jgi:hypothetical protein
MFLQMMLAKLYFERPVRLFKACVIFEIRVFEYVCKTVANVAL